MFVFAEDVTYDWPVEVWTPSGGAWTRGEFVARFRLLPVSRMREAVGDVEAIELVREALAGWRGIDAGDGTELPYSDDMRDRLLDHAPTRRGLLDAFMASYAPKQDRSGNSAAPRSIGSAAPAPNVAAS